MTGSCDEAGVASARAAVSLVGGLVATLVMGCCEMAVRVTARIRAGKPIAWRTGQVPSGLKWPLNLATVDGTEAAKELAGNLKVSAVSKDPGDWATVPAL